MKWNAASHSANETSEYLFRHLIPYIGNKRKLLGLIKRAIEASDITPETHRFVDLFAGTGVVGRFARHLGYSVLANDWEPYSAILNRCYLELSAPPLFFGNRSYDDVLSELNALPDREDWVTKHLCPRHDESFDITKDRLFYMRKNGRRIDAIRNKIAEWEKEGKLSPHQQAALLAPLLYQCCYNANTSGVFKGFHNGWGGKTETALYRIKGELKLRTAVFLDNGKESQVTRSDAQELAPNIEAKSFVYLDPPYNQHPYGSNYHVLNSVTLWDKPELSEQISGHGDKAAIRTDWRTERRSAYNYADKATAAYKKLLKSLKAEWIATSYSTDGMISLRCLIEANLEVGDVQIFTQPYKRYRVSTQRYSQKPMNIEFIVLTKTGSQATETVDSLTAKIREHEKSILEEF